MDARGGPGGAAAAPQISARLEEIAARHPQNARLRRFGRSAEGRPLLALEIGHRGDGPSEGRVVVVAGLDGAESASVGIALSLAARLAAKPPPAGLEVVVVPAVDVDGVERFLSGLDPSAAGGPMVDDDGDARYEEDPPRDVDGDGFVTWMRVVRPVAPLEATRLLHPDDPRLLVEPDPKKGEAATHALLREGLDADGDGRVAEDGPGGVRIDRSFPIDWPEEDRLAGRVPLERSEARALADLLLSFDDLWMLFVLGRGDRLEKLPKARPLGRARSLPEGIAEEDRPTFERVRALRRETVGERKDEAAEDAGSLHRFAYAGLGAPAFAIAAVGPADVCPEDTPTGRGARERAWLALAERVGWGFRPWKPFEHPTLGGVEIGGFVPGFLGWAPDEVIERRAEQEERFLRAVSELRPRIELEGPRATPKAPGVYEVELVVRNAGGTPTETHVLSRLGLRTAHAFALVARSGVEPLAGEPVRRVGPLAPGEARRMRWIVRAPRPDAVEIEERSRFGGRRLKVLPAGRDGGER